MVKKRTMFSDPDAATDLYLGLQYHNSGVAEADVVLQDWRQICGIFSRMFIVLDAFDELAEAPRAAFLKEMFYAHNMDGVNLSVTSGQDVVQEFSACLGSRAVALEVLPDEQDLKRYIAEGLSGRAVSGDDTYPNSEIISIITRAATSRYVLGFLLLFKC